MENLPLFQQRLLNMNLETFFNIYKFGLFYKLPNKSLALQGETCHGAKHSRECLTMYIRTNMDDSKKLPSWYSSDATMFQNVSDMFKACHVNTQATNLCG
jgi:hypothetical protein